MWFLLLCATACFTQACGSWTVCTTRDLGSTPAVICHISKDLNLTKRGSAIFVQRYSLNTSDPNAETVAKCIWLDDAREHCSSSEGYVVTSVTSIEVTIAIPNRTETLEGRFLCNVPCEKPEFRFCHLEYNGMQTRYEQENTTQSLRAGNENNDQADAMTITAVVLFVLIAVIGVVILVRAIRNNECRRNTSRTVHAQPKETVSLTSDCK
ncbi:hypothetical protein BaRGS_00033042 [Batillaria attramentaria]|uniref:Uncharacterized protein n=1 Tax=Batillaria attramentaria TaxID=370345 RepID=A0ABD0JLZ5_9CAEN